MRTTIKSAAVVALIVIGALGLLLAGCSGMVPKPTLAETLLGTWRTVERHDDRTITSYLTFTKSRFIRYTGYEYVDLRDDTFTAAEWGWGGWEATKTTITKKKETSVLKQWEWVEPGQSLNMSIWRHDDATEQAIYERVEDPIQGGILGKWQRTYHSDGLKTILHMELGDKFIWRTEQRRGETQVSAAELIGSYTVDHDELRINIELESATVEADGIRRPEEPRYAPGTMLRVHYAPTVAPESIILSTWIIETTWDPEAGRWIDKPDQPYGHYSTRLVRPFEK